MSIMRVKVALSNSGQLVELHVEAALITVRKQSYMH